MSERINIILQDEAYNTYTANVDPNWNLSKVFETAADILGIPKENTMLAHGARNYRYVEACDYKLCGIGIVAGTRLTILKAVNRG